MSEAKHLAKALRRYFADERNGWHCPFTAAVAGLTAAEAARVPAPGANSIWAIVNHIRCTQETILFRLRSRNTVPTFVPQELEWPEIGSPDDEAAWQADVSLAMQRNEELVKFVADMEPEWVAAASPNAKEPLWLYGLLSHTGYHIGQIVEIRRLYGKWEPDHWLPKQ
jgi:hypothetical protein